MDLQLDGLRAVVTGGGCGIGLAIARGRMGRGGPDRRLRRRPGS
jgi:NAD(P)-dependent dehydrogenase (short-subunit alcohol dehydrogenase family)